MMRRRALLCAMVAGLLIPASAASAAEMHLGSLSVPHTQTAPPIDGTLDSAAWKTAASATLSYDLRNNACATEHTNGVGLDTDDEVQVDLWPNGTKGFRYKFTSTSIGTHYQYSTENNSFEPEWWSAGRIVPGGYAITMKIPLAVMHGTGSGDWRIQFIRYMPVTNHPFVWSFGPAQTDFNDVNYSGSLSGLPKLATLREKARFGI